MKDLKHTENYFVRTLLNKAKLSEVMTENAIAIDMDEPFSRVEEKMREHHIRHLPVVDKSHKLVGLVTQRDLYRIQSPRKDEDGNWFYNKEMLDSNILKHVMNKDPFTLSPDHTVADALLAMVEKKYGCIPIVDKHKNLCGIITQVDILKIGARILREGNV